jgi:hypothetical protein
MSTRNSETVNSGQTATPIVGATPAPAATVVGTDRPSVLHTVDLSKPSPTVQQPKTPPPVPKSRK